MLTCLLQTGQKSYTWCKYRLLAVQCPEWWGIYWLSKWGVTKNFLVWLPTNSVITLCNCIYLCLCYCLWFYFAFSFVCWICYVSLIYNFILLPLMSNDNPFAFLFQSFFSYFQLTQIDQVWPTAPGWWRCQLHHRNDHQHPRQSHRSKSMCPSMRERKPQFYPPASAIQHSATLQYN